MSRLHLVLDDACQQPEVMFGLVHFLESFDVEEQVRAFIQVMPKLMERSPEWTAILHSRIANDAIARSIFEEQSSSSGASHHQKNLLDLGGQIQFTPDFDRKALRETH